ncbi:MAG: chloride channel protein [Bacteroidales bacterium]|nr:chloride channel protein [Bacteroidales bacterium]
MSFRLKTRAKLFFKSLNKWRLAHLSDRQFMMILAIPTGFLAGLAAVLIKFFTHSIRDLFFYIRTLDSNLDLMFFVLPAIGILLTIIVIRFIIKREVGHGIPGLLYALSRNKGIVRPYTTFSSIITSALTVGFGGSVGLEGPSVSTGGSIGSNIGQLLKLNQKQINVLIGMGGASALAAIFQAPITGVVFAMEVFMIDISMTALVPIIISAFVAILTSYYLLGRALEYEITIAESFIPSNSLYYVGLGVVVGLVSAYFMKVYFDVDKKFRKIENPWKRFVFASLGLGALIFVFPSLYGEGYETINAALNGKSDLILLNTVFEPFTDNIWLMILIFVVIILCKAFATSFTFAAGGVGGTFAPALFLGAMTGMVYALIINNLGMGNLDVSKFALVGMSGLVAAMLHAPLTGIFLIAEITNGYSLMVPLMIVAALSLAINRIFFKESIYTRSIAEKGVKVSFNKDETILSMMTTNHLIETNFISIRPDQTLGDLIPIIASSSRNIFPVVAENGDFKGHILFDDVRKYMFDTSIYDTSIEKIMVYPDYIINPEESMESVVKKFEESRKYNIPIIDDGKYLGYISRANVFTTYQAMLKEISAE